MIQVGFVRRLYDTQVLGEYELEESQALDQLNSNIIAILTQHIVVSFYGGLVCGWLFCNGAAKSEWNITRWNAKMEIRLEFTWQAGKKPTLNT